MRLGGGDTTYEILQTLSYGDEITSRITNMDESLNLQFTILWVEESVYAMDQGVIDWSKIEDNYTTYTVKPGETMEITTDDPKKWHLMILHNDAEDLDDVIEVRILNDYGKDEMWKAVALSLPSMWMTGFIVHRLVRLKQAGRSLIDSTPSHLWEEE